MITLEKFKTKKWSRLEDIISLDEFNSRFFLNSTYTINTLTRMYWMCYKTKLEFNHEDGTINLGEISVPYGLTDETVIDACFKVYEKYLEDDKVFDRLNMQYQLKVRRDEIKKQLQAINDAKTAYIENVCPFKVGDIVDLTQKVKTGILNNVDERDETTRLYISDIIYKEDTYGEDFVYLKFKKVKKNGEPSKQSHYVWDSNCKVGGDNIKFVKHYGAIE